MLFGMIGCVSKWEVREVEGLGREGRTDAEGADEDADDVCVADFLDDGVAAHEELVRAAGLQSCRAGPRII